MATDNSSDQNRPTDDKPQGEPASNQPDKSKRRLKPPQTMREQSAAATAKAEAPRRRSIFGKILLAPFRLIAWLLRPPFRFLNRFKLFRFIGYIFVPPFARNAWRELKLVDWPNFRQTRDLTVAVIIFSIIFGVIVAIVDYGFDKLFRKVILDL